jgi:hypothetical protein
VHHYTSYGLSIFSDLDLPELLPAQLDAADVIITRGQIASDVITDGKQLGPFLYANRTQLLLEVPDVARYLIENGNRITYQPLGDVDADSIRVFLLGSCFGALLFQRGFLVLHGNAIRIGDGCVICVGHSGAGKSTLAGALVQRGYSLLADDVCAINARGFIEPGFPRIKLWADTAKQLGIDTQALSRIRPDIEKFNWPLADNFCDTSLPVRAVYVLHRHNKDEFVLDEVSGMDRFQLLRSNSYRSRYMKGMQLHAEHLKLCSTLAQRTRIARITRPQAGFQLDALVDVLLGDLAAQGLYENAGAA